MEESVRWEDIRYGENAQEGEKDAHEERFGEEQCREKSILKRENKGCQHCRVLCEKRYF